MKKVIVTGASGFIGRHTLSFLKASGYEALPFRVTLGSAQRDVEQLLELRPYGLLHLAWETTPKLFWHSPANFEWHAYSLELLKGFVAAGGKRVVIAGSCAEQFPSTPYGACKERLRFDSELLLHDLNVSNAWGRIFFPYGPEEKNGRLLPSLIQTLLSNTSFTCTSQTHVRDFLFVEDVARALVTLFDSEAQGTVDIGSGIGTPLGHCVTRVAEKMHKLHSIILTSSPGSPDNPLTLVADTDRLFNEVGFKPRFSLEQGLDLTLDWWKKNEIRH